MVKLEQIKNGIASFIEREFFPTMEGTQLWAASFGLGLIRSQADAIIAPYLNKHGAMLTMMGIISENGEINIESAIESAKETVKARGKFELNIPFIGIFKLGEGSFDKLYQCIIDAGQK